MKTSVDLERVRIKMEVARMRASGPVRKIPSGRVFDSPPDADATNGKTARTESSPAIAERIRSASYDTEDDEPLIKKISKAPAAKKLKFSENTQRNAKASSSREGDAKHSISKVCATAAIKCCHPICIYLLTIDYMNVM